MSYGSYGSMRPRPDVQPGGALTNFDDGTRYRPKQRPPALVTLRNRETGEVTSRAVVDAREILAQPGSIYEPVTEGDHHGSEEDRS